MKTLYFCRHAKSDWSTPLPDHERPLNKRGLKSVPVIAKVWQEHNEIPAHWVSSSAVRALHTAQLMSAHLSKEITIRVDHDLYLAAREGWMKIIGQLPEAENAIALFGHNPGITDIVNTLSGSEIDNIPTCGLVRIDFELDDWASVAGQTGTLCWFEYPKRHMA